MAAICNHSRFRYMISFFVKFFCRSAFWAIAHTFDGLNSRIPGLKSLWRGSVLILCMPFPTGPGWRHTISCWAFYRFMESLSIFLEPLAPSWFHTKYLPLKAYGLYDVNITYATLFYSFSFWISGPGLCGFSLSGRKSRENSRWCIVELSFLRGYSSIPYF